MSRPLLVDIPGVHANASSGGIFPEMRYVFLAVKGDKVRELRTVLHRVLNTWPEGPPWAFELCDLCDKALEGACTNS